MPQHPALRRFASEVRQLARQRSLDDMTSPRRAAAGWLGLPAPPLQPPPEVRLAVAQLLEDSLAKNQLVLEEPLPSGAAVLEEPDHVALLSSCLGSMDQHDA